MCYNKIRGYMNREINENLQFFKYLDASVEAYKKMSENPNTSFFSAVKNNPNVKELNSIAGSDVLLSKTIFGHALLRRILTLALRENTEDIKFEEIEENENYINFKNRLFKDYPSLTNADCNNILKQICNKIAHGEINTFFKFDVVREGIKNLYYKYGTIEPKNSDELYKILRPASSFSINYTSLFEFLPNGSKVRRASPLKVDLEIDFESLNSLLTEIYNDNNVKWQQVGFYFKNDSEIGMIFENGEESIYKLDEIQKEEFKKIKNECQNFFETMAANNKNFSQIINSLDSNVYVSESSSQISNAKELGYYSMFIALQNILVGDKFIYLKIRNLQDIGMSMANVKNSKRKLDEYLNELTKINLFNYASDSEFMRSSYANLNLKNLYKEVLVIEIVTMLEKIENIDLKSKIIEEPIFDEIANDVFEENDDKNKIKILNMIRNAFVHGKYINGAEDSYEIYDQISSSDKTLEHKFTIYTDELEKIKTICLKSLEEFYEAQSSSNELV